MRGVKKYTDPRRCLAFFLVVPILALSCMHLGSQPGSESGVVQEAGTAQAPPKTGAKLWAQNCSRCHNLRPASSLSGAQWELDMLHMRVRANLTTKEHAEILGYLKAVVALRR